MDSQPRNLYPKVLTPYQILQVNPYNCNLQILKYAFKMKMQGNESPEIRLSYDMVVNSNEYIKIDEFTFMVKNINIFYYAHVGGLREIKRMIEQNNNLLYTRDNLGRTILYLAARNGYYELCKYLLEKGADINDYQNHGNTPLQSAIFYGHNNIVQLINEHKNNINKSILSKSLNDSFKSNKYTIYEFDEIIKKEVKLSSSYINDYINFFNFFKENHTPTHFNNISIFDKNNYDTYKNAFYTAYKIKTLNKLEKACIGAMLGMAIGDAIGERAEFYPLKYDCNDIQDMGNQIYGKFQLKPGQWTDDTSMGLCLADSLLENNGNFNGHDFMLRLLSWWYFGYNNTFRFDNNRYIKNSFGLGGNVAGSFKRYLTELGKNEFTTYGDENTSGNGSIIRNAPIPICFYKNLNLALDIAEKQSRVTHKGNEAAGCCQLMTFITIKILEGENLKDILKNLKNTFKCKCESVNCLAHSMQEGNDPDRNWNWNVPVYKYSFLRAQNNPGYIGAYSMDAMAMALHILMNTNSFKEAILKGVNLRGDADSLGAVIGQLAGAYYGLDNIPEDWIKTIHKWDPKLEIALRGYILCHLFDLK